MAPCRADLRSSTRVLAPPASVTPSMTTTLPATVALPAPGFARFSTMSSPLVSSSRKRAPLLIWEWHKSSLNQHEYVGTAVATAYRNAAARTAKHIHFAAKPLRPSPAHPGYQVPRVLKRSSRTSLPLTPTPSEQPAQTVAEEAPDDKVSRTKAMKVAPR
ncbi:hypothetical protein JCM1840_002049 [Sporobolomyces johnsonii]